MPLVVQMCVEARHGTARKGSEGELGGFASVIRSQQHMVRSQNAIEKQREKQDKNPVYVQTPNVRCFLLLVLKIGLGLVVSDGSLGFN